jgi:hypothetical protein
MVYEMVWGLVYIGPPAPLAEGLSNPQIVGYSRVSGVIYKRWLGAWIRTKIDGVRVHFYVISTDGPLVRVMAVDG